MRKCIFFCTILILLLTGMPVSVWAQTQQPVLPSAEPAFIYNVQAQYTELLPQDIIKAGLAFSECPEDSEEGLAALVMFEQIQNTVSGPGFMNMPPAERGEAVLELLYRDVLKRYQENESRIHIMFSKGIYNCVSSSLLYLAAARAAGLTVSGQKTPDHAFCTLTLETGRIDVETTNPYGFNPGSKKEITSPNSNAAVYAYIPKRKYANRAEVSDRVFVSLVGGNESILYMNRGQYNKAIPLAAARYVFLDGETSSAAQDARTEFDIICTNYVNTLQKNRQYEASLQWASEAITRWGITDTWKNTLNTAVYNTAAHFLNSGFTARAQEYFEQWQPYLSPNTRQNIANAVFTTILTEETKALPPDEKITYLKQAAALPEALDKNIEKLITDMSVSAWMQKAAEAANKQSFLEAADITLLALSEHKNNAQLQKLKDQCLQNYAAQVHNTVVQLHNQSLYEQARSVIEEGLFHVPANKLLQNDLAKINQLLQK